MSAPRAELRVAATAPADARRLTSIERGRLACEIAIAYVRARLRLRRGSIDSVLCGLRSRSSPAPQRTSAGALAEAQRLGRAVARVLRLLPGDTRCLVRSLVLTQLLAKRGIATKLVIGTRTGPDFLAHAWIEYDGEPVISPGDGSFGRLAEL
jgi:hypothetical protein